MIELQVVMDGENADGCWPDLAGEKKVEWGELVAVARLTKATKSSNSVVYFRIEMLDGSVVLTRTTMALFLQAAGVFEAREALDESARRQPD